MALPEVDHHSVEMATNTAERVILVGIDHQIELLVQIDELQWRQEK